MNAEDARSLRDAEQFLTEETPCIFNDGLAPNPANDRPITPLSFLNWAATVYPDWTAIIYGDRKYSYAEFYERCCRLSGALAAHGIRSGDTVSVIAPNVPAMLEAHYGVPMLGATVNPINPLRSAASLAHILEHSEAKLVLVDQAYIARVREAIGILAHPPKIIDILDPAAGTSDRLGEMDYETFLAHGSANFEWPGPDSEWRAISLNYTQGTAGLPKGVVFHHRGAYLNATGDAMSSGMHHGSVYLWSLPMYRSNGWCYAWAVTAVAGTHICLREHDNAAAIFRLIREHNVTHLCGTHGFLDILSEEAKGAPPFGRTVKASVVSRPPQTRDLLERLSKLGLQVTFLYGLTECFGVAGICGWEEKGSAIGSQDDPSDMTMLAHSGAHSLALDDILVVDPDTMERLPADGKSVGAIVVRGNAVAKGYLKNPEATEKAFRDGWFHTRDRGILHPDGHIEIIARAEDIIDHSGTPISAPVVEEHLRQHKDVVEVAVLTPSEEQEGLHAYVVPRDSENPPATDSLIQWCQEGLPESAVPQHFHFETELPRTEDGEIQRFLLRQRLLSTHNT